MELEEAPCHAFANARDCVQEDYGAERRKLSAIRRKFQRTEAWEKLRCKKLLLEDDIGWCPASDSQLENKALRDLEHLQETRAAQFNARKADNEGVFVTRFLPLAPHHLLLISP